MLQAEFLKFKNYDPCNSESAIWETRKAPVLCQKGNGDCKVRQCRLLDHGDTVQERQSGLSDALTDGQVSDCIGRSCSLPGPWSCCRGWWAC